MVNRFFLFLLMITPSIVRDESDKHLNRLLARGGSNEENIDSSGTHQRDYFVFQEDGSFHIERRHQDEPKPVNILTIFEGKLNGQEISALRQILKNPALEKTTEYVEPHFPLAISSFQRFVLTTTIKSTERHLGYFKTAQVKAVSASSQQIQDSWAASSVALHPFVNWFIRR